MSENEKNTYYATTLLLGQAQAQVLRPQRAEIIIVLKKTAIATQTQSYPSGRRTPGLVLVCHHEQRWADLLLAAPSCSGHMPHFAARVVRSHSLQPRNVSQQPSSFGALLFVPKACEDCGFLPTVTCLRSLLVLSLFFFFNNAVSFNSTRVLAQRPMFSFRDKFFG